MMKSLSKGICIVNAITNQLSKLGCVAYASSNAAVAGAVDAPAAAHANKPVYKPTTSFRNAANPRNIPSIVGNKPTTARSNKAVVSKIVSFNDISQLVYDELRDTKRLAGAKWARFPRLTEILKGHRPGEMTVFTGTTGVGKTTFISEYSIDLCQTGNIRTLWCSFEIQYVRLAKIMLHQHSRINLRKELQNFPAAASEFQQLPMHFLDVHGPAERVQDVLDTLYNSVQQLGIQHVIVDNLQFMIGLGSGNSTVLDRFHEQDKVVQRLRQFATQTKCHVTLVVHPRKEAGEELLTVQSIYGGGKVTQEADNVMILQKKKAEFSGTTKSLHFIEVCKNRYDGELGWVPLHYDKNTFCMSSQQPSQIVVPGSVIQAHVSLEGIRQPNNNINLRSDPDHHHQFEFDADIVVEDADEGAISYLN